jgi:hypothetical protein
VIDGSYDEVERAQVPAQHMTVAEFEAKFGAILGDETT